MSTTRSTTPSARSSSRARRRTWSADSKIGVDYQYAPFLGGGNTSLMGLSLGYDLGRDSKVATTWLYQSESIVGEKAKLGEEPSKNLVGNFNVQHTFKPTFLTKVANFLSRNDSERESTVQFGRAGDQQAQSQHQGARVPRGLRGRRRFGHGQPQPPELVDASVPQLGAEWLRRSSRHADLRARGARVDELPPPVPAQGPGAAGGGT